MLDISEKKKTPKCDIFLHMYFDKKMGNKWYLNAVSIPAVSALAVYTVYPGLKQWAASNHQLSSSDLFHVGKPQSLRTYALAFLYKR